MHDIIRQNSGCFFIVVCLLLFLFCFVLFVVCLMGGGVGGV